MTARCRALLVVCALFGCHDEDATDAGPALASSTIGTVDMPALLHDAGADPRFTPFVGFDAGLAPLFAEGGPFDELEALTRDAAPRPKRKR